MQVFSGTENQLQHLLLNNYTVIIYHRKRKAFRTFAGNYKSKWNKVLGYCGRSVDYSEDRYFNRIIKDYHKQSGAFNTSHTYLIMYSKEDLSSYRTLEGMVEEIPSAFI